MKYLSIIIFFCCLVLSACSTYQIPVDSFYEQFKDRDPAQLNKVIAKDPLGGESKYLTNSIDSIYCFDKKHNIKKLKKKPSLELRVTLKNGKKTTFYADQVFVRDSLVCGQRSMFSNISKCISLNDIVKIEVQDGHKNFNYK